MKLADVKKWFGFFEQNKIRSQFFFFTGNGKQEFRADVLKPYSFELVNIGVAEIIVNGNTILSGTAANNSPTSLIFPRVGIYKRNDILVFTFGAVGTQSAYIRADMELEG